jgi:hypothetical protein
MMLRAELREGRNPRPIKDDRDRTKERRGNEQKEQKSNEKIAAEQKGQEFRRWTAFAEDSVDEELSSHEKQQAAEGDYGYDDD